MLKPSQTKILLVIEELKLQDFVALVLMGEGYKVKAFFSQKDALEDLTQDIPDLIITDFLSPKVDGLSLCKTIRKNTLFRYTPIVLLIPKNEPLIKTKAIYSGADDFIEKPFLPEELLARIKAALWRTFHYQDLNPLTKLYGMSTAIKELNVRIEAKKIFGVGYADLYHFRRFNERYGFKRGDEVLKNTAILIYRALSELGTPSDFLAHFGEDDFFFITSSEAIDYVCKKIVNDFQETISSFYDEEDRKQGFIRVKNRRGEVIEVPLLRIHIECLS
jgi:diguanylate cyclase (GGDEF)-like protein